MDRHDPDQAVPQAEIAAANGPITLDLDHSGNGPRLKVGAPALGRAVFLDPLELEALTWAPQEIFEESPAGATAPAPPDRAQTTTNRPAFAAEIANEFARVSVELEHSGAGTKLRIGAARLHRVLTLDPAQLEALTAIEPAAFEALLATPFGPEADDRPGSRPGEERG